MLLILQPIQVSQNCYQCETNGTATKVITYIPVCTRSLDSWFIYRQQHINYQALDSDDMSSLFQYVTDNVRAYINSIHDPLNTELYIL
jgi:hypothetical protein